MPEGGSRSAAGRPLRRRTGAGRAGGHAGLAPFDVLLLDEPTNDLDADGLARLDRFLTGTPAGVVLVTHDRTLLARHARPGSSSSISSAAGPPSTRAAGRHTSGNATGPARPSGRPGERTTPSAPGSATAVRRREWARQGAHRARTRRTDNAKALWDARAEAAENLAAGAGQIERKIARSTGGQAARAVAAVDRPVRRAARGRRRRPAGGRGRRARRVHAGAARPRHRLARPDRAGRPQRHRQVDVDRRPARHGAAGRRAPGRSGPSVVPGSMDQARTALPPQAGP